MGTYHFEHKIQPPPDCLGVELLLFVFEEDETTIIYAPALNLSGYGKDEQAAVDSLHVTLEEFLRYTTTQKTFDAELRKLGWKLSGKKNFRKYVQPSLPNLLQKQDLLTRIFQEKEFHKINGSAAFPVGGA